MANPYFQFKQFTVWHDRCGMKVGTDGVLLGALAPVPTPSRRASADSPSQLVSPDAPTSRILDIGTGSGLIALMLAQRFPGASLLAIDIDKDAVEQARENVARSPFHDRIRVEKCDFSSLQPETLPEIQFDAIVSNPPFFIEDTFSAEEKENTAKHTASLSFETLIRNSARLLAPSGLFSVILPTPSASSVISLAAQHNLYLSTRTDVRTTPRKAPKRTILTFAKEILPTKSNLLTIRNESNEYTPDYQALTSGFYL